MVASLKDERNKKILYNEADPQTLHEEALQKISQIKKSSADEISDIRKNIKDS